MAKPEQRPFAASEPVSFREMFPQVKYAKLSVRREDGDVEDHLRERDYTGDSIPPAIRCGDSRCKQEYPVSGMVQNAIAASLTSDTQRKRCEGRIARNKLRCPVTIELDLTVEYFSPDES